MEVCIYGAGAIGGWLAAAFDRAGARVNVVARGATLAALQQGGMTLVDARSGASTSRSFAVNAVADPTGLGHQDVVVIAVKAPALRSVADRLAPLLGPTTTVLTAMNGVPWWFFHGGFGGPLAGARLDAIDPDGAIGGAVAERSILGSVVHASCSLDGPGAVRQHSGNGLIVGEPSGGSTPRLQEMVELLKRGGIDASSSTCVQRDVWYKLWGNMTVNPISALTGATTDKIVEDELLSAFIVQVMNEAQAIGALIGAEIAESPVARLGLTRRIGAFRTSMLQDVDAGRPVELDALVTAVREMGVRLRVPTPFTDALLGLARVHARQRGLY